VSTQQIHIVTQIASTSEAVWNALTDPDMTQQYWGGTRIEPWTTVDGFRSIPSLKDVAAQFDDLDGESGGLLSDEDVLQAAEALEPGTAALMAIFENSWP